MFARTSERGEGEIERLGETLHIVCREGRDEITGPHGGQWGIAWSQGLSALRHRRGKRSSREDA